MKAKNEHLKTGNIADDFNNIEDADWVIEAVVERVNIKHDIYEKFLKKKKDSIVSSNTSTIPLKILSEKLSEDDKKDFCITHF